MLEKFRSEIIQESIRDRKHIEAPEDFVSVYHETKEEFIPDIDRAGLRVDTENKRFGDTSAVEHLNGMLESYCPDHLRVAGVTRRCIYAYPNLEHGHGLGGAARRYERQSQKELAIRYETFSDSEYLQKQGIHNLEEYIAKMNDPEYRRAKYPGTILEMKVDPEHCFVGDMAYFRDIQELIDKGFSEKEAYDRNAIWYWKEIINLKDFFTWYRKPQTVPGSLEVSNPEFFRAKHPSYDEFYALSKAPTNLPDCIRVPEVLIPDPIPQKHIRLLD